MFLSGRSAIFVVEHFKLIMHNFMYFWRFQMVAPKEASSGHQNPKYSRSPPGTSTFPESLFLKKPDSVFSTLDTLCIPNDAHNFPLYTHSSDTLVLSPAVSLHSAASLVDKTCGFVNTTIPGVKVRALPCLGTLGTK